MASADAISGLDLGDLSFFATHADEAFTPVRRTTSFNIGEEVEFFADLGGSDIQTSMTIHSAKLVRLTHLLGENSEGTYNIVTGNLADVKADLWVHLDGEKVSLQQFLCGLVNRDAPDGAEMSLEGFEAYAARAGFRWSDPMYWFFQHFGADTKAMEHIFDAFLKAGARDITHTIDPDRRGRMQRVIAHQKGIEVVRFEMSSMDRSMSKTGQGFLNPLEAQVSNFQRVVALRRSAYELEQSLQSRKNDGDETLTAEVEQEIRREINSIRRQSSRWNNTWTGSQEVMEVEDAGGERTIRGTGQWQSANAPCGRLTVMVPAFEQVMEDGEPKLNEDGTAKMRRVQEPVTDDDGNIVYAEGTDRPLMKDSFVPQEWSFWASDNLDLAANTGSDVATTETVVDTTSSEESRF